MRRCRWQCVAAVWLLSAGCIFGSRPILPAADTVDGGDLTVDSGTEVRFDDAGATPTSADAGRGWSDAGPSGVQDHAVCVPRDGGAGDGGDAGWVLRDGGEPCDPAINASDGGTADGGAALRDATADGADASPDRVGGGG